MNDSQDHSDGGEFWGPLHRDAEALDDALGVATAAVSKAARIAMWQTEKGFLINSPLADLLGGLGTVIDALIDQRGEARGSSSTGINVS